MSTIFTMRLRSVGNPDFGQYASVSDPEDVQGSTLAEMRDTAQAYIDKWDLGGGNWTNPVIKQGSKVIGHFSYNLRFWEGRPGRWDAERCEILITDGVKDGAL
jgi:hypothetical protein